MERRASVLTRTEHVTEAAQFQVLFRDHETVIGLREHLEAGRRALLRTIHQHAQPARVAAADATAHPLKALWATLKGPKVEGPMAPEIDLSPQRPAEFVFDNIVQDFMDDTHSPDADKSGDGRGEKGVSERSNAA